MNIKTKEILSIIYLYHSLVLEDEAEDCKSSESFFLLIHLLHNFHFLSTHKESRGHGAIPVPDLLDELVPAINGELRAQSDAMFKVLEEEEEELMRFDKLEEGKHEP